MLVEILVVLAVVIALLAIIISLQPPVFLVSRTAPVNTPASTVFKYVNNLHNWDKWSPWSKLDPNAQTKLEGPAEGVGAIFRWDGDSKVGAGSMLITESRPNELVGIQLDFLRPFKGTNTVQFTFKPDGNQTLVTWAMEGKKNFMAKAMHMVINCDKMIGKFFDEGLANLNDRVQGR